MYKIAWRKQPYFEASRGNDLEASRETVVRGRAGDWIWPPGHVVPELLIQHAVRRHDWETKWGWLALASSTFRSQVCNQSSTKDCAGRTSQEIKRKNTKDMDMVRPAVPSALNWPAYHCVLRVSSAFSSDFCAMQRSDEMKDSSTRFRDLANGSSCATSAHLPKRLVWSTGNTQTCGAA